MRIVEHTEREPSERPEIQFVIQHAVRVADPLSGDSRHLSDLVDCPRESRTSTGCIHAGSRHCFDRATTDEVLCRSRPIEGARLRTDALGKVERTDDPLDFREPMCKVLLSFPFEPCLAVPSPKPVQFSAFRGRKLLPSCIAIPTDLCRDPPVVPGIRHWPTNATSIFGVVWRPFRPVVDTILVDDESTLRTVPLSSVSSELDLRTLGALVDRRREAFESLNTGPFRLFSVLRRDAG